jgi:hypothetical protein
LGGSFDNAVAWGDIDGNNPFWGINSYITREDVTMNIFFRHREEKGGKRNKRYKENEKFSLFKKVGQQKGKKKKKKKQKDKEKENFLIRSRSRSIYNSTCIGLATTTNFHRHQPRNFHPSAIRQRHIPGY